MALDRSAPIAFLRADQIKNAPTPSSEFVIERERERGREVDVGREKAVKTKRERDP